MREPRRGLPAPAAGFALANASRAFRHRNYRLFFGSQLVSLVGTWMQSVAQAWLVLELTGDPFLLGLVAAMQFLPVTVLGLFGGLIADALPKRRTLIATQTMQMLLAFSLFGLVASGLVEVWHIVVFAALLGISNAVDMPTRQAFVVEMVGREHVANAVALNSAVFNGARIVGPAIAGLVIGAVGGDTSIAFLVNGLSFLAVICGYALMRDEELNLPPLLARPTSVADVRTTLAEGLRYVRRTDLVLMSTIVVGLAATFGMNFVVIVPAFAREVLHTDATGYGFLMAASGIGSFSAAMLIAFSGRSEPAIIGGGALVLGLSLLTAAMVHAFVPALVVMALVGMGAIAMAATANTTIQLSVPDELRGRVIAVYTTVFVGSTPLGGLLVGFIASRSGVEAALAVSGIACAMAGVTGLVWLRRIRTRAQAASPAPGEDAPAAVRVEVSSGRAAR
jgi:MFS family permease